MTTDGAAAAEQAEQQLYDAMARADLAALESLLAPEASYVHSNGVEESRHAYLQAVGDGIYEYDFVRSAETITHVLGESAMMTGRVTMSVGPRGAPKAEVLLLSTLVWIRNGPAWRLLRRHATRIPGNN